ncbi:Spermidine N(1)-acetyltransferase [Caloramator mitchellensis]|uniref:Spermidine N(1)-acetyltransferase n=1 Tax=Caloramator mitchellensis TaxID=908809 RepID=A0A0R3K3Z1_CALMK|nr:GNAT family protein [Caloramator mitchellensis]KRQ87797.1 Spermidine N(1)-acetyltransferase [Caloramator mitchellensis]
MKELMIGDKKVIIRPITADDAAAMIDYMNVIGGESDFLTFGPGELNITLEVERNIIKGFLEKNNALFIVAVADGKIIGALSFSGGGRKRLAHTGEFGVSVLKEYWGKGIGQELIKYLIDWAKETKIIRKINLRTRSDNERAVRLYKKLGFEEEGLIRRDFMIDGKFYDSLMMGMLID